MVTLPHLKAVDAALHSKSYESNRPERLAKNAQFVSLWNIELSDGTKKLNMTIHELAELANSDVNPIVEIQGYSPLDEKAADRRSYFVTGCRNNSWTVEISISDSETTALAMKHHLLEAVGRMNSFESNWLTYKWAWIFPTCAWLAVLFSKLSQHITFVGESPAVNASISAVLGFFTADVIVRMIPSYFFPRWQCVLGDGNARYEKLKSRRSHFFWSVIVALLISLLSSYIYS